MRDFGKLLNQIFIRAREGLVVCFYGKNSEIDGIVVCF